MLGDLLMFPLHCGYLGYAVHAIGRPPWLRDFYCWYGFYPGLALLYEPFGVGDCKGPHDLTVTTPGHGTCGTSTLGHHAIYTQSCMQQNSICFAYQGYNSWGKTMLVLDGE